MRILKWLGIVVALIAVLIGGLVVLAPYGDGPIAMIPGGPLESGGLVLQPVENWSFVAEIETIEMQLIADDDRSRTTWVLSSEGAAYIPVTLGFPPGKAWHVLAADQGAAVVRANGARYPVTLVRIVDPGQLEMLGVANARKYPPAPGSEQGSWYFRLDHRPM